MDQRPDHFAFELQDEGQDSPAVRLIGLTGAARSGKSTVAEMLSEHGYTIYNFADPIKNGVATMFAPLGHCMLSHLKDDHRKDWPITGFGLSPRDLWKSLGTEWGRFRVRPDIWIRIAAARLARQTAQEFMPAACFADVRFTDEAKWIRDCGGEIWEISRPGTEKKRRHAHPSEIGIARHLIDHWIKNDCDLDTLAARVEELLR